MPHISTRWEHKDGKGRYDGSGGGAARQVGMSKKGSARMVQAAGESKNFFFLYRALDFLHRERKMQLHVPSQPFQASVVCKNEGVVVGFVPCGGPHSILYANKRLFCILTTVWWQGSARGAAEGECGALAM